jgi:hypothetical protein
MSYETKMTKRDARREMEKLMKQRDDHHPAHPQPDWIKDFWTTRRSMLS